MKGKSDRRIFVDLKFEKFFNVFEGKILLEMLKRMFHLRIRVFFSLANNF